MKVTLLLLVFSILAVAHAQRRFCGTDADCLTACHHHGNEVECEGHRCICNHFCSDDDDCSCHHGTASCEDRDHDGHKHCTCSHGHH